MLAYSQKIATNGQCYLNTVMGHVYVLIVSEDCYYLGDPFNRISWKEITRREPNPYRLSETLSDEEWMDALKQTGLNYLKPVKVTLRRAKR